MSQDLAVDIAGYAGDFSLKAEFSSARGITGVFGHSGSGKTTLLKMIAGLMRPQTGRIAIAGRTLFDAASNTDIPVHRRQTGFVFQDGRLFPHLSVRGNLNYANRFGHGRNRCSLDDVCTLLGLGDLLERSPATLSGGERQRVAIGRALLSDPQLLLMDEPLSSLDHARRNEVLPYLERLREETQIPIIYVSHEIDEVVRLADTLVVLSKGTVIASGPTADVFNRIDLGPALGRYEAGAMLDGKIADVDSRYGLARVAVGKTVIELVAPGLSVGNMVRMRIRARDVAIALSPPDKMSIRNCVPAVIGQISREDGPYAELLLNIGGQSLRARITTKSLDELGLEDGKAVYALLKAVSVERRALAASDGDLMPAQRAATAKRE